MLSKNDMVAIKEAIESTYIGVATVYEYTKVLNDDRTSDFKEILVFDNIKCRLSFDKVNSASEGTGASGVSLPAKVFMSPEFIIKAGSKISILQNNITYVFKNSGISAIHNTHQEIKLEFFERWT